MTAALFAHRHLRQHKILQDYLQAKAGRMDVAVLHVALPETVPPAWCAPYIRVLHPWPLLHDRTASHRVPAFLVLGL